MMVWQCRISVYIENGMIRVVYLPCAVSIVFIFYVCCRRDVVRCVGVVIRVRKRLIGVNEHEVIPPNSEPYL